MLYESRWIKNGNDNSVVGRQGKKGVWFCALHAVMQVWYFVLRGTKFVPGEMEHINLWTASLKARSLWAHVMMSDSKSGLEAVHTIRNLIISVSLLAAAEASLIASLLNILTDPAKLEQIDTFSKSDPISDGNSFVAAEVKVALTLGVVALSLLIFAQCVRIAVHLGFLIRIVPVNMNVSIPLRDATFVLTQRMSLYFALGLRFLYAFVPLMFYMTLGALALAISTGLLLIALLLLDIIPAGHTQKLLRETDESLMETRTTRSGCSDVDIARSTPCSQLGLPDRCVPRGRHGRPTIVDGEGSNPAGSMQKSEQP